MARMLPDGVTVGLNYRDVNNCLLRLPMPVVTALKGQPGLFLAGGLIRACIAGETINDVDLFVRDARAAQTIAAILQPDLNQRVTTDNAVSLDGLALKVQLIHRWTFATPEDCIASFDFTICSAAIWWNANAERWDSTCDPSFYSDLAAKRLVYRSPVRNEDAGGSMLRVLKYVKRGYGIPRSSLAAVMARAVRGLNTSDEVDLATQIKDVLAEVDPPTDPRHEGISRSLLRDVVPT